MSSNYEKNLPNQEGYFGEYGGKYVPETLMLALSELESVSYTHLTLPTSR